MKTAAIAETAAEETIKKTKKEPQQFWTFGVRLPLEVKDRLDSLTKAEYKELVQKIKEVLRGERAI